MAVGNSIIARMGVDLNGLKGDLSAAEKLVVRSANDMQAKASAAGGGGGHGHGGALGARSIGDALDGITGTRGWAMRMQILQASLPIAALAGLAIGFEKVTEAVKETKDATKEANAVMAETNSAWAAGPAEASRAFKQLSESIEKVKASRGALTQMGDMLTGGHANRDSMAAQRNLESARFELASKFNITMREGAAARRDAEHSSERELAHLENQQKLAEKTAQNRASVPAGMRHAAIAAAESDSDAKDEEIDRKADSKAHELSLERAIMFVKMSGCDVALEEAKARLTSAMGEMSFATTAEQKAEASLHIEQAKAAVVKERLETEARHRQLAAEVELGNLSGDPETKRMAALISEARQMEQRREDKDTTPDDREKLGADLAKNQGQQRDLSRSQGLKAFDAGDAIIDANKGTGQLEEQLALYRKIALEQSRIAYMRANDSGAAEIDAQVGKLADMARQYREISRARSLANEAAGEENAVLEEKLKHNDAIAEAAKSQFDFQKRINEAIRDGNGQLAKTLQLQAVLTQQVQIANLQRQVDDKSKATIAELAAHSFNADGMDARRVMRLEARANQERVRGHAGNAAKLQNQADKIRKNIAPLKDSEKAESLLEDQLAELKAIAKNTANGMAVR